jgi:FkbM family methyltransferase
MGSLARVARWSRALPPSIAKERVGRALSIGATRLGADPLCRATWTDGTEFELDALDRTQAGAIWNGSYETDYHRILTDLIDRMGAVVYDVGANVGLVAVPLARHVGQRGTIVCFEPVAENYRRLRRNIALNGLTNCVVHQLALGDTTGTVQIAREVSHGSSSGNAVLVSASPNLERYDAIATVPIERLDDVVEHEGLPLPNVIKLDVEGAEVGFLAGARKTLRAARPVILGEFNSGLLPKFGHTFLDAAALLPADYAIFGFADAHTVVEKEAEPGVGDVLLVPRERIGELPLQVRERDVTT